MGIFDFLKPKKNLDSAFEDAMKEMSDSIGKEEFNRIVEQAYADMKSGKIINLSEVIQQNVSKERLSQVSHKQNNMQNEFAKLMEGTGYELETGTNLDVIPEGFGRFGLDPTNPIPVNGIGGGYMYLDVLKDQKGNAITYSRIGSMSVDNIKGLIDRYEIYDSADLKLCDLYLSPYNQKNSTKRPAGLY
jgi:hypothetical protein